MLFLAFHSVFKHRYKHCISEFFKNIWSHGIIMSICVFVFSQISSLPYDERPLPALRKRSSDQPDSELDEMLPMTDTTTPRSPGASGQPEPLPEKAQREASLPIDIYGDSLVRHPRFTASIWLILSEYLQTRSK